MALVTQELLIWLRALLTVLISRSSSKLPFIHFPTVSGEALGYPPNAMLWLCHMIRPPTVLEMTVSYFTVWCVTLVSIKFGETGVSWYWQIKIIWRSECLAP